MEPATASTGKGAPQLKPLKDQVMVILGASSGIGRLTAITAAQAGVKVVMAARSEATMHKIADEIRAAGGQALVVACDVTDRAQVDRVASAAVAHFGRIDTWVHSAGVAMFGRLDRTDTADAKRLFDINFFGTVNGCQAALPVLKRNANGGALICLGSEESDDCPPLQGMYCATKHAIKGYVDCLRVEVQDVDHSPVAVTLILPQGVDTPVAQHARNYMDVEGKIPSPLIKPEQVVDAILSAAVKPTRNQCVGPVSYLGTLAHKLVPKLQDKLLAAQYHRQQKDRPATNPEGILWKPCEQIPKIEPSRSEDVHPEPVAAAGADAAKKA
jgi:NADP-dependent 3-hydroxy acid dehydrogenase YdfG